jgi:urea transport system permease protein
MFLCRCRRILPAGATLLLLALAATAARGADLKSALTNLASDERGKLIEGVETLGTLGNADALPILEALRDDKLRVAPGAKLYILSPDGKQAAELGTGKQGAADSLKLDSPPVNNAVRRSIEGSIAQLQLFSNKPDVRRKAALDLANRATPDDAKSIQSALARETEPVIRNILLGTLARLELSNPDRAVRLKAIRALGEAGDLQRMNDLQPLLATKEDGAFAEPDGEIRAAATSAIASIQQRQTIISIGGNLLYGLSLGSVLLLAALGLAITFGLMGIINMAHGEMLMLGAYTTYVVQNVVQKVMPAYFDVYVLLALPAAFAVCALIGIVLERAILRFLYRRPLESLLATWGISLGIIQTVRQIFGAANVTVANPGWLSGGYSAFSGLVLPYNRIFIVLLGAIVVTGVWLLLQRTSLGLQVRAVTQNRPIAATMGIRTARVNMWTFALGSGIAGIGGVALSQIGNVGPELGQSYIVDSFMVVVLGGVGKIAGTVAGAMGLGIVAKYLEPLSDAVLGKIILLVFIILFIQRRPQGLFALKGRAAEG